MDGIRTSVRVVVASLALWGGGAARADWDPALADERRTARSWLATCAAAAHARVERRAPGVYADRTLDAATDALADLARSIDRRRGLPSTARDAARADVDAAAARIRTLRGALDRGDADAIRRDVEALDASARRLADRT